MKKLKIILLTIATILIMTNNVFAKDSSPIPWSEDFQDVPFSPSTDGNGQTTWRYYKQGEGLITNRWVQNYKYDWYYCGEDGFLLKNTWLHDPSDGKYYYLGNDWIMLQDTTTPDGYKVGSDGAWIKDGEVVVESVNENLETNK